MKRAGLVLALLLLASPASAALSTASSIGTAAAPGGLRALACTSASDIAIATGFWQAGDMGGGVFYCDPAATTPDDGGTVIPGAGGAGRWRRLVSDGVLNVRWFGAKGDQIHADDDAFAAALAVIEGATFPGGVLYVPTGWYILSKTITIRRTTKIYGEGGDNYGYRTRLKWRLPNIDGIVVRDRQAGDTFRADSTRIEDMIIQGTCSTTNVTWTAGQLDSLTPPAGSGIVVLAPQVKTRNLLLNSWCQDGISVRSSDTQNANLFTAVDNQFYGLGRHGMFMGGGNAQGGYTVGTFCSGTLSGYCIYDRSMYGSGHFAPLSDGAKHSYWCAQSSLNACTVVAAYQEALDGPSSYGPSATLVGGTWGNSWVGTPIALANDVAHGRGLVGGVMSTATRPTIQTITRGTAVGPTSCETHTATVGIDSTIVVDVTNGLACFTLQDPASQKTGYMLTFVAKGSGANAKIHLSVGGGKPIGSGTTLDILAGQSYSLVTDGVGWMIAGKGQ